MLYEREPVDFKSKGNVSGVFCKINGEFLLLKRKEEKSYGSKWALPGGKEEIGETPLQTSIRETKEETGIDIQNLPVNFFKTLFERYPDGDFTFNIFQADLTNKPQVELSEEHEDFAWVTPQQAFQMDLIEDLELCIKKVYNLLQTPSSSI